MSAKVKWMKCLDSVYTKGRETSEKIPTRVPTKSSAVGSVLCRRTWGTWRRRNLMKAHLRCWSVRSMHWAVKMHLCWQRWYMISAGQLWLITLRKSVSWMMWAWKRRKQRSKETGLTGHKSSDDEVSSSLPKIYNSKLLGVVFLGSKNVPLIVRDKCFYRFMETVIYLITSPKIKELGRLGGNFHNCYGSYIAWSCFP